MNKKDDILATSTLIFIVNSHAIVLKVFLHTTLKNDVTAVGWNLFSLLFSPECVFLDGQHNRFSKLPKTDSRL